MQGSYLLFIQIVDRYRRLKLKTKRERSMPYVNGVFRFCMEIGYRALQRARDMRKVMQICETLSNMTYQGSIIKTIINRRLEAKIQEAS